MSQDVWLNFKQGLGVLSVKNEDVKRRRGEKGGFESRRRKFLIRFNVRILRENDTNQADFGFYFAKGRIFWFLDRFLHLSSIGIGVR
jgi:hypothetical protein